MTFANNLKNLRAMKCISQAKLADVFGFTQQAVGRWEQGQFTPDYDTLVKLSKFFNVSTEYLLGRSDSPTGSCFVDIAHPPKEKTTRIPVLGRVAAGIPIEAIEDIIDYEELDTSLPQFHTGIFFGLVVRGHSMTPTLRDKDVIIIRQQEDIDSGDIAVVLVGNEDATVKEVKKGVQGITLIGHNPSVYTPTFYSNKEIQTLPVRILGKVVELRRRF